VNEWSPAARRLGFWSALSVAFLGAVYLVTGLAWLAFGGLDAPDPLQPGEPYLWILEFILLLTAPPLVVLAAAVHAYAPAGQKTGTLAALAFMTSFAVLTGGVHFARLAVGRQAVADAGILRLYPWPSVALGLDLVAWDLFLGLALLFAAPAFTGCKLANAVRIGSTLSGALCVFGFFGLLLGDMRLQFLAIAGYAVGLPVVCALLAVLFRRERAPNAPMTAKRG
jgi:hypothetical protein